MSQPALSMQIRELEEELQVSLVERRKSGVALTDQGEEIAGRGRTILASVRDLLDYAKHQESVLSGTLRLGAIPSIAPYFLPAALPELHRRFPELDLQLRETMTGHSARAGSAISIVILIALPIDDPEIETASSSTTVHPRDQGVPADQPPAMRNADMLLRRPPVAARGGPLPSRSGAVLSATL